MKLTLAESGGLSVLGILVVFAMLVAIMFVIMLLTRVMRGKRIEKAEEPVNSAPIPAAAPSVQSPVQAAAPGIEAPGSAGEIKLYNVPDRQAAMVMAIRSRPPENSFESIEIQIDQRID